MNQIVKLILFIVLFGGAMFLGMYANQSDWAAVVGLGAVLVFMELLHEGLDD